jgi:hypothetical protein
MHLSVSLWLFAVALGETPGDASTPVPSLPAEPSDWVGRPFAEVLEEAKGAYFSGDQEAARRVLEALRMRIRGGEEVAWGLQVDALTYLGEIYYLRGDRDLARDAFRAILERDVDTPISPYHHSYDVVTLFDLVRSEVLKERVIPPVPVAPPPPKAAPWWIVLPLGAPQFGQRRPAAGLVYGGLQAGLGAASIALFIRLDEQERDDVPAEDRLRLRNQLQVPLTAGAYLSYGISVADAARWHRRHPASVGVGASPDGAPQVVVGGRF